MIVKRKSASTGKRAYQVRVKGFRAASFPTLTEARVVENDLKMQRRLGELYEGPGSTVGEELAGYLDRKKTYGGRHGRLRPRSIEFLERSARFWSPIGSVKVSSLRRARVEDLISDRARAHPRSARNELELLKAVLREARDRGQRIDDAVLRIPTVWHVEREGRALSVDELDELTSWAPEYIKRIVSFAGTSAARASELFTLEERQLDLAAGTMTVPRMVNKSRRDKVIQLAPSEAQLLREQLLARPASTSLVFPKLNGGVWNRHHFRTRVWVPLLETARKKHREQNPVAKVTPFDGLRFHDLRHTATSLMCTAGLRPELVAERRGDADGGALVLRRYRHLYPAEMVAAAALLDGFLTTSRSSEGDKERTA